MVIPTLVPGLIVFWVCMAKVAQKTHGPPHPKSAVTFFLGVGALIVSLIALIRVTAGKFRRWLARISADQLPQLFAQISKANAERAAARRRK